MLEALERGGHAPSSGSTPATSLATQALPPDTTGRHQMKGDPRGCGPPWRRMRSCGPGQLSGPVGPAARAPRSREGGLAVAHSILVIAWQFSQRPALSRAGEHLPWFAGCGRDSHHPVGDCWQYLGLPYCRLTVAYAWNQSGQDDLRAAARLGGICDRNSWLPDPEGDQYCRSSLGPLVPRSRERYLVRLVEADWMAKSYRPLPVTAEVTSKSTV